MKIAGLLLSVVGGIVAMLIYLKSQGTLHAATLRIFSRLAIAIVIAIVIIVLLSSCNTTAYWRETRKTGIERYGWNRAAWPRHSGCSAYYTSRPIKYSTMRRLHYSNHKTRE
jgi:hypothetical protein